MQLNFPLIIHMDGTIYFYKEFTDDDKYISNYLKQTTVQIQYTSQLEIYKIEDFSIISLVLFDNNSMDEFINFLERYSYNIIPSTLLDRFKIIEQNIKVVSLELGKTEIIIRVMKGDLSFLYTDKKFKEKIKYNDKEKVFTYPRKDNYKLIEDLTEKDVNIVFPTYDARDNIELKAKKDLELRYYQQQAFNTLVNRKTGLVIMPVSSGKTYLGIKTIEYFKKGTLIFCENKNNCFIWKDTLLKFLDIDDNDVFVCVSEQEVYDIKKINIYSYDVLRSNKDGSMFEILNKINWGVIIYDNAHKVVTEKSVDLLYLKSKYKFAFDSTINRSDGMQRILLKLFGGVTYNITSYELVKNLYQKKLECFKVDLRSLPVKKEDFIKSICSKSSNKSLLIVAHRTKDIYSISEKLNIKSINKDTKDEDRISLIQDFNYGHIKKLCISNLIEKYPITNIDVMIAAGYRGSTEIEENFRIGTLVGTTSKLSKITVVKMYYLIKSDVDKKNVSIKERSLIQYGIVLKELDYSEYLGDENKWS